MQQGSWGSYSSFVAVAPSDTTPINCRALYIGGVSANLVVTGGPIGAPVGPVTFITQPGQIIPICLEQGKVNAATTATGIIALS